MRIGDAERDECISALCEHHAWGRLSVDELDRRQTAALTAVSAADLAVLLSDLPEHGRGGSPEVSHRDWRAPLKERALRATRWALPPTCFVTSGVMIASADGMYSDERQFVAGVAAAGIGYVTHLVVSKWPKKPQ